MQHTHMYAYAVCSQSLTRFEGQGHEVALLQPHLAAQALPLTRSVAPRHL